MGASSTGVDGELYVRTPSVIEAYIGEAAQAGGYTRDGYFRVGDIGHIDEDGYLYITGRMKDVIIRGGVNIFPAEIEAVLLQHPDVTGAAVIGVPDEEFGERVAAFCEIRTGAVTGAEALAEFAKARLTSDKRPAHVEIVAALPRNDMEKIVKAELRRPFWSDREFSFGG